MRRRRWLVRGCILLALALAGCGGEGGGIAQRKFELTLRGGALPADQQLIRVGHGDDVILTWTTDQPAQVHLHGYDIHKELTPGTPTTMWFVARATGRFPITRHVRGSSEEPVLTYLEVHPR